MNSKYLFNNINRVSGRKRFKCMICGERFGEYDQLYNHTVKYHKDDLDPDISIHKYLYDLRNPGPHLCFICKVRPRIWDEKRRKYRLLCGNPECKKKYRENFQRNMKKKFGTDNLLNDPERQLIMLQNRKISHIYKFKDGTEMNCVGNYEYDFLRHCEIDLNLSPEDIEPAPSFTYLKYYSPQDKKTHTYIPDFYMPKYNLVIEIKDSSKFPVDSKYKAALKCKAVVKNNKYNYIKIVDENYTDFEKLLDSFKDSDLTETNQDHFIFIIPESKSDVL